MDLSEKAGRIWACGDILRGDFQPWEYGPTIFSAVLILRGSEMQNEGCFANSSGLDLRKLLDESTSFAQELCDFTDGFGPDVQEILHSLGFYRILRQARGDTLSHFFRSVAAIGFSADGVSNQEMGDLCEELNRLFLAEIGRGGGEHFTPRDIIGFALDVLFTGQAERDEVALYDPTCGTGGTLLLGEHLLKERFGPQQVRCYGQDINAQAASIYRTAILLQGKSGHAVSCGNSLTDDQFGELKVDFAVSIPPFNVDWQSRRASIEEEYREQENGGRFRFGLPRKSDGSFLFLMHLMSKLKAPDDGGGRLAILLSGQSLHSGGAGSAESEIRRGIIQNDWLEAIIALPNQLFHTTSIGAYIWVLTNKKAEARKGRVQLLDAREYFAESGRSGSSRRKMLDNKKLERLLILYKSFKESQDVQILKNESFGFQNIVVDRPLRLNFSTADERISHLTSSSFWTRLKERRNDVQAILGALHRINPEQLFLSRDDFRDVLDKQLALSGIDIKRSEKSKLVRHLAKHDPTAQLCATKDGPESDTEWRRSERIPLGEDPEEFLAEEVHPSEPGAWINTEKTKIGYEIDFDQRFHLVRFEKAAKRSGGELAKLGSISSTLYRVNGEINRQLTEDSIFIPDHRSGLALTHAEIEKEAKIRGLLIECDPAVANADYLVNYFNTELGRMNRDLFSRGWATPRIVTELARSTRIALPELETQEQNCAIRSEISVLKARLAEIEERLSRKPLQIIEAKHALKSLSQDSESIVGWLETLPFPLASILWTYHAEQNPKAKYEHLFHFFEAAAQFVATVLLSGFEAQRDHPIGAQGLDKVETALKQARQTLKLGQFGTWVNIIAVLRKLGAKVVQSSKEEERRLGDLIFRSQSSVYLSALLSSQALQVLEKANKLRNSFTGHGTIVGETEAERRLAIVKGVLTELRRVWGLAWEDVSLLSPEISTYRGGIFRNKLKKLTGSRTPFPRVSMESRNPLDADNIYLAGEAMEPLPLLPLLRLESSPESERNACYFFNRVEKDGVRFVSYHFEQTPELTKAYPETVSAIERLFSSDEH